MSLRILVFLKIITLYFTGVVFVGALQAVQSNKKENVKVVPPTISGDEVLARIDKNLYLDHAISITKMVIHRRSRTNTITAKTWMRGKSDAFSEYLSPAREKGKKMLRLEDKLWIYVPEPSDRIIAISGHLLRQSVMGSDLSYEDMMNNDSLSSQYIAVVKDKTTIINRPCILVELTAKVKDISYYRRKLWVDSIRWIPLKEELFAKSGKLLKRMTIDEVMQVEGRWYPKKMTFKDVLSRGKGTEYYIEAIDLKTPIPDFKFNKAALRR